MKIETNYTPTPMELAVEFCEMADENQAQFFIDVAELMKKWPAHGRSMQAHYIGRHLRNCACSTYEARELVREIAEAVESAPAPKTPEGSR